MEKDFTLGLIIGLLGGALFITNSYKARKMVKDGQEQIKNKVSQMSKKQKQSDDYDDLDD